MTPCSKVLENFLLTLPGSAASHAPGTPEYEANKRAARKEVEAVFGDSKNNSEPKGFPPFGDIIFPYRRMGVKDSLNLFDFDEIIIFSFYWAARGRYKRAVDIGANLGLHSILMSKAGFTVRCYEPDPVHFELLQSNLAANGCAGVTAVNKAVSSREGSAEFVRVLDNTTGSHLAGAKKNPYGKLDRISVRLESVAALRGKADLFKIDAEGHEKEILLATDRSFWADADALIEVGGQENAEALYRHFNSHSIRMFAQKLNWGRVSAPSDMPASYREGTLFVTCKDRMPWP